MGGLSVPLVVPEPVTRAETIGPLAWPFGRWRIALCLRPDQ